MSCQNNPHVPRKGKKHNRFYPGTYYNLAGSNRDPPICIPIKAYCAKYFLSRSQVIRAVKAKYLCAVSFKKALYVEDKPIAHLSC
jgi:hypothetical protein